jgi:hypothetical protein
MCSDPHFVSFLVLYTPEYAQNVLSQIRSAIGNGFWVDMVSFMVSTLAKGETEGRDDASIVFGQFFYPLVLYICELSFNTTIEN